MNLVTVSKLTITNFRSFAQEEFVLPFSDGLKFISGDNQVEARLGANGAGKSSLWEALVWALYGTSTRGARAGAVVSWGADKAEVTVDILIGPQPHSIRRSGPPNKLEIDGQPAEQPALDRLVGLSKFRLLHSVVFGQGQPLFPDLSITERGDLLDEVLGLSIWSRCTDAASLRHKTYEQDINGKKQELKFLEGKLASLETEESIQLLIAGWEQTRQEELKELHLKADAWNTHRANKFLECSKDEATFEEKRQNDLTTLRFELTAWREKQNTLLDKIAADIENLEGELKTAEAASVKAASFDASRLQMAESAVIDLDERRAEQLITLGDLTSEIKAAEVKERFWAANNTCPTCEQAITVEKKALQLGALNLPHLRAELTGRQFKLNETYQALQLEKQRCITERDTQSRASQQQKSSEKHLQQLRARILDKENEAITALNELEQPPFPKTEAALLASPNPYTAQRLELEKESNPYYNQVDAKEAQANPFIPVLDTVKKAREELSAQVTAHMETVMKAAAQLVACEYWKQGFKRIRLYFVQRVLSALQIEIASAISALGLDGWSVTMATETENKSGTMKLGVQIHIKSPIAEGAWETWSGGESQRLRLAIAMGLASLIQRAAGVKFGFEVWDEPSAWLSSEGIEDLLEALRYRAEVDKKQVWIVDHRALTFSGFREIWTVRKEAAGSRIYKVAEAATA